MIERRDKIEAATLLGAFAEAASLASLAATRRGGVVPWARHGALLPTLAELESSGLVDHRPWVSPNDRPDSCGFPGTATWQSIDSSGSAGASLSRALDGLRADPAADARSVFDHGLAATESERSADEAVVVALMAALLHEAAGSPRPALHCHFWLSETIRRWLPQWLAESGESSTAALSGLRHLAQEMVIIGINLRGLATDFYLAAWRAEWRRRFADRSDAALREAFASVTLALTYVHGDMRRTLEVVVAGPGRVDLAARWFGLLAGAWYGPRVFDTWAAVRGTAASIGDAVRVIPELAAVAERLDSRRPSAGRVEA